MTSLSTLIPTPMGLRYQQTSIGLRQEVIPGNALWKIDYTAPGTFDGMV